MRVARYWQPTASIPEATFSFAPNEHFDNVELNGPRGVRISYCQTFEREKGPHSPSVHREEWLWAASCLRGYLGTKDAQSSYAKTPDGPTCPRNHAVNALYRVSLPPVGLCPVLWRGCLVSRNIKQPKLNYTTGARSKFQKRSNGADYSP